MRLRASHPIWTAKPDASRLAVAACAGVLAACAPRAQPASHRATPDFAVVFLVRGEASSANLLRQTSRYVLEANRSLRSVRGAAATRRTYPPLRRRLTAPETESIFDHLRRHQLLAEPTSPGADQKAAGADDDPDAQTVIYELSITAHGRTHRYATTPRESPPTIQLLKMLAQYAW